MTAAQALKSEWLQTPCSEAALVKELAARKPTSGSLRDYSCPLPRCSSAEAASLLRLALSADTLAKMDVGEAELVVNADRSITLGEDITLAVASTRVCCYLCCSCCSCCSC